MRIYVRLSTRVERELADYCVAHKLTKNAVIKRALEQMFEATEDRLSPFELGRKLFERNLRTKPTHDIARHTKRLLRRCRAGF